MKSPALIPFLLVTVAAGADLPLEEAAWLPLADNDRHALIPAETRSRFDHGKRPFALAALALTSRDRLTGSVARRRDDSLIDGGVALGLTASGGVGAEPDAFRNSIYVRGGSDPGASAAGEASVAVGAAALWSWAGGPFGAWADVGWSHERDTLIHLELMGLFSHLVIERDQDVRVFRWGMCLRWPGEPVARTPGDDPWSFALAVDGVHTDAFGDRQDALGADLVLGWRVFDHIVLEGRLGGVSRTLTATGDDGGVATATFGIATVW